VSSVVCSLAWNKCRQLNSDLYLDLSSKLYAELNREKFEKLFKKLSLKSFVRRLARCSTRSTGGCRVVVSRVAPSQTTGRHRRLRAES